MLIMIELVFFKYMFAICFGTTFFFVALLLMLFEIKFGVYFGSCGSAASSKSEISFS